MEKTELMNQSDFERLSQLMADKGVRHEAFELLADLRQSERVAKQEVVAITDSIVVALEGLSDFEGLPVSELNYLQVIRKLKEDVMEKSKRETGGIAKFIEEAKRYRDGPTVLNDIIEIDELQAKAYAYDRIMSGGQKTPKEIANIFGFPIAMDCYSSNHEFQHGSDWNWFTTKPFIDGENDCWTIKRGQWGRVPYGLLNGYDGDWKDSLTLPDEWEEKQ